MHAADKAELKKRGDRVRERIYLKILLVCMLDFTAESKVNTNAKFTPNCQLREREREQNWYSELPPNLCKFPEVYSLIYNFSV